MALTAAQTNLVDRTLRKFDALDAAGSSIAGSQGHVYQQLQEASREILYDKRTPERYLHPLLTDDTSDVNAELSASSTSIRIPLMDDFLRVFAVKLSGWSRTLRAEDVLEDENTDTVERLVAGTQVSDSDFPLAAIVYEPSPPDGFGDSSLLCYPGSSSSDPVTSFVYVPVTAPESIGSALTEPMLWKAAALVAQPIDPEIAYICEQRYDDIMNRRATRTRNVSSRPFRYL